MLTGNLIGWSFRLIISHVSGMPRPGLMSFKTASFLLSVKGIQCRGQAGFAVGLCCLHLWSGGVALSSREPGSGLPCPVQVL